jgi:hypothetical protein
MPKNLKQKTRNEASLSSLAKSIGLLRSEMRISNQEIQAGLIHVRDRDANGL